MSIFTKISNLWNKNKTQRRDVLSAATDMPTFVRENHATVKKLLCSYGYNDMQRRLTELADMVGCPMLLLCSKQRAIGSFSVIECSDSQHDIKGKIFQWQHVQVAASSNASQIISELPFPKIGANAYISVPIKNKRNMVTGIILGLYVRDITNVDDCTRLLHLVAPTFESEIQVEQMRLEHQQYETRIASLNQNLEIMQSDLNREREKSVESSELKRLFLTNLSQEIRTPMNAVVGFIDLLGMTDDPEETKHFIEIIKQNSLLTLKVIDSLVEISKLQSSYLQKSAVPSSLNQLINDTISPYVKRLRQNGNGVKVELKYALETPNDTIWNSDEIIKKVLELILDNSCEFTTEGTISIRYDIDHKEARFEVRDTGPRIQPGEEHNIFNISASADTPTESGSVSRVNSNLSLARKYIELAGGRIWVDTNYAEGACFYFTIPTEKL